MKISFITTIFNEEKTIEAFIHSLLAQTILPDEIIIVDGGSTDLTISKIKKLRLKNYKGKFVTLVKKGNRSVGRNEAVKKSTGDIIVCSDAGSILDKHWIKNIVRPFKDKAVDVVAGYYKGKPQNIFQKCLLPYVLVMPDKVDPNSFLPATRSIAFTKAIWKKVGGFNEKFSHNEDYVFANKLKEKKAKIVFAKDAIAYWLPRTSLKESFIMFFRFALGDAESGLWRSTVLLLFARYFLGLYLIFLCLLYKSIIGSVVLVVLFFFYLLWAIQKNYHYIKRKEALFFLPVLQLIADMAVLSGTFVGILKNIKEFDYVSSIKKNKFLLLVVGTYLFLMLLTLRWGIPNQNHPFPYHMDEWHQLQAVGNTFRYGTPNTEGSANGTMFHFILSGFYLLPFTALQLIDPFSLQLENVSMREKIFEVLRLQTIIFGILSIIIFYKITQLLNVSTKVAIFLFTFNPIWLSLSGYFKYDIALLFWILLSLFFLLHYAKNPSNKNYLSAAIPIALSIAVKVSALPLLVIYLLAYFLFHPSGRRSVKIAFLGLSMCVACAILFGLPDTLFGKGDILLYLYGNIIQSPASVSNFNLGMHPLIYLFSKHYMIIFGHGMMFLLLISVALFIYVLIKESINKYKKELFIGVAGLIFLISILPLQIYGGGNRSLVLLPFFVLVISFVWKKFTLTKQRGVIVAFLSTMIIVQVYESAVWIYARVIQSPQAMSSEWIEKNIPKGEKIGLENVPIYQGIPDILQKEFYFNQYNIPYDNRYTYQIIDSSSKSLPSTIVVTNDNIEPKLLTISPKRDLLIRLKKENYKKIMSFSPSGIEYLPLMNDIDYYFSWLVAVPSTISVYIR